MAIVEVKFTDNKDQVMAAAKEQINGWLKAIGEDAAETSAKFAPYDTGRLKGSISSVVDENEKCVYIGTNVEYAIYHEFGTGKYASDGGGRATPWAFQDKDGNWHYTSGVPARHFIQFGCTAHQAEYKEMLEAALKQ
jgi:phage gpG-like protein